MKKIDDLDTNETHNATHEPIWFQKEEANKPPIPFTGKEEKKVHTINIGARSPYKVMVCTPVHGEVSMHYVPVSYTHLTLPTILLV